jgi:Domain of unknown function (DUF4281)
MNMETILNIGNLTVMPFWLIMIALPRFAWAVRLIRSPWIALPPGLLYVITVVPMLFSGGLDVSAFGSLSGVAQLLGNPVGATAGWMHFLAFDLFVGRWIYLDGIERKISPWAIAPTLFLTFMFGPIGLLLYLLLRLGYSRLYVATQR